MMITFLCISLVLVIPQIAVCEKIENSNKNEVRYQGTNHFKVITNIRWPTGDTNKNASSREKGENHRD